MAIRSELLTRLEDLERKFLDERRGGYCFEQNTLFAAALREVGFAPVVFLGRVRRGAPELWARTHMVLAVPVVESEREHARASPRTASRTMWLVDVGYGGKGLVEPMPLCEGASATQRGLTYTLRKENRLWVLAMVDAAGSALDLYEFADDPQTAGDVVVANYYMSTHPASAFRRAITIQRIAGNDRLILCNDTLARYRDGRRSEELVTREQLPHVARELFDVELPAGPLLYESCAVVV